jgi:glycosyltransferase involved in cell wall biosynthesis
MLVFGGRTTAGKGFDLLLDAYRRLRAKLRDVTLVVTGARVGIVEPGVLATGRLDSGTWADCLSAATAVVVPGGLESLSLLALEAWASGRPCLVNGLSPVLAGQAQRSRGYHADRGPRTGGPARLRGISLRRGQSPLG